MSIRQTVVRFLFVLGVVLAVGPTSVSAQATPEASPISGDRIQLGADWILGQEAADGGWIGFNGTSDAGTTIDAVLALAAARNAGATVDLTQAQTFLEANGAAYAQTGSGAAAKLTMAVVAMGLDGRSFAGIDPLGLATANYNIDTKLYGNGVYDTGLVLLAYGSLGRSAPGVIIDSLDKLQISDGSWAFDGTTDRGNGDTNTTAIIVQGLVSVGEGDADMVHDALNYLTDAQLANGFSFQPGSGAIADANSTGIVVQALISAGEDPGAVKWQNVTGALSAFQLPDGSYSYMLDPLESNLFASVQALPAAAGQAFPIKAPGATNLTSLPTCTPAELESATPEAELACAA